jgi:hypothetical protein
MANDDRPTGWTRMVLGVGTRSAQTIRIAPPTDDKITWPQRPQHRGGELVRVKVLVAEAGAFLVLEPGEVRDLPAEEAAPRLKKGTVRLARPDERLTSHAIE